MRCHRGEHGCAGVDGLLHRCRDVGDVDGGISKSTGAAPSVAIGVVGCLGRLEDLEHRLTVVEAVHRALWELEYAIEREAESPLVKAAEVLPVVGHDACLEAVHGHASSSARRRRRTLPTSERGSAVTWWYTVGAL